MRDQPGSAVAVHLEGRSVAGFLKPSLLCLWPMCGVTSYGYESWLAHCGNAQV